MKRILTLLLVGAIALSHGQTVTSSTVTSAQLDEKMPISKTGLASDIFYDSFSRADTASNSIGTGETGQSWVISGSGSANARISSAGLRTVSPRGTMYCWPQLSFNVRRFGCRFKFEAGGGAAGYVNAMILSKLPNSLVDMLHITWNANTLGVQDWRSGSAGDNIIVETFTHPLVVGEEYTLEIEIIPELDMVIMRSPSGAVLSGTHANVSEYHTPYCAFESIDSDTGVYWTTFTDCWAIGGSTASSVMAALGDVMSSRINRNRVALLDSGGKIFSGDLPSAVPVDVVYTASTLANLTIAAGTTRLNQTADRSATTFNQFTLPAASTVAAGRNLVLADVSGTMDTGHFITFIPNAADTIVGMPADSRWNGEPGIAFVSNGINKWYYRRLAAKYGELTETLTSISSGSASVSMAVNNRYRATAATLQTYTLPASANVATDDEIEVIAQGAGGVDIAQNASQTIRFGASVTTAGTGGKLTLAQGSVVRIKSTGTNSWQVVRVVGTPTVQ